eukprot:m.1344356 g.1344356  ORF g.1344356 m.1344356 type:complete len:60 (+) comp24901_c1_seq78:3601-3780(+)
MNCTFSRSRKVPVKHSGLLACHAARTFVVSEVVDSSQVSVTEIRYEKSECVGVHKSSRN